MKTTIESPRLFVLLLAVSLVALMGALFLLSFLTPLFGLLVISFGIIGVLLGLGIIGLVYAMKSGRDLFVLRRPMELAVKVLYPVSLALGQLVGLEKDVIRGSFIELHNRLANMRRVRVKPSDVLVLLPHCLQWSECAIKITNNVGNCKQCGKCTIGNLTQMQQDYGFHMSVATGGTLARKIIKEIRPKVVIGVACERDLTSGIQDVRHIHVLGVTNERPFGPCFNTTLDLEKIEETIKSVIT